MVQKWTELQVLSQKNVYGILETNQTWTNLLQYQSKKISKILRLNKKIERGTNNNANNTKVV